MLLLILVLSSVALVPAFGGRPHTLAEMRLHGIWFLLAAIALQVALVLAPGQENAVRIAAYLGSYLAAGGFLVANRHISGLWLIGLGAALNFSAIVANGGVMPSAPHAIAAAGLLARPGVYSNSIPLAGAHLSLLGDIFAIPASWPFSNVFSIGDICIAIGAVVTVHRTTGSRLVPDGSSRFAELARDRSFVLGTAGRALSSVGGWTLAAALVFDLARRAEAVSDLLGNGALLACIALLFLLGTWSMVSRLALSGTAGLVGTLVGSAECLRVLAILSLAATSAPSLLHLEVVAACLGATAVPLRLAGPGARPSADRARAITEDSVRIAVTGLAVLGAAPLASMLLQAGSGFLALLALAPGVAGLLLVARVRSERVSGRSEATGEPSGRAPLPIAWIVFGTCAGLAAALPLQPAFAGQVLGGETSIPAVLVVFGFATGVLGAGLFLGAVASPALESGIRAERLLPPGIAALGLLLPASSTRSVSGLLFAWFAAGVVLAIAVVSARSIARSSPTYAPARAHATLDAAGASGLVLGGVGAALLSLDVDLPIVLVAAMAVVLACAFLADRLLQPGGKRDTDLRGSAPR